MASGVTNLTVGTFLISIRKRLRKAGDEISAQYGTTKQTRNIHPLEAHCGLK